MSSDNFEHPFEGGGTVGGKRAAMSREVRSAPEPPRGRCRHCGEPAMPGWVCCRACFARTLASAATHAQVTDDDDGGHGDRAPRASLTLDCPYPRHAGHEWRLANGGPWVCGVCHPPVAGLDVEWSGES